MPYLFFFSELVLIMPEVDVALQCVSMDTSEKLKIMVYSLLCQSSDHYVKNIEQNQNYIAVNRYL